MPTIPNLPDDPIPRHAPALDALDALSGEAPETEQSYQRLAAKMTARVPQARTPPARAPQPHRVVTRGSWLRWSALAVAACAVMIAAFRGLGSTREDATTRAHATRPATPRFATAAGQRATVTLPDGTVAVLGPDTRVWVTGRTVDLTGEAHFTVAHDPRDPFVVRTAAATVRVLGTTFGVRHYETDADTRVAVADGKVMVQQTILAGGDLARADKQGRVQLTHDAEQVMTWLAFAQGTLVISAETLADAAPQIGRWFDLDVHVDGAVAQRPFSATFQHERAIDAIGLIATLTNTTYTRQGRVVTFTSR